MKKFVIISLLIVFVFMFGCKKPEKKVMLIFSYHAEFAWVQEENAGVDEIFKDKGYIIDKFYLDTKRQTSEEWKAKIAEEAKMKINEFQPDIVVVFDDNACELIAKQYIGSEIPFVFCGMNGKPEDYGFPAKNITGVVEREWWKESADLMKEIMPEVKSVVILLDSSETALKTRNRIVEQGGLPFEFVDVLTINYFDKWKQIIQELQDSVDAIGLFVYFTLKDTLGEKSIEPEEVLNWTLMNNKLPEFAIIDFTVQQGALCGYTESGADQGKAAAEIAVEILNGKIPENIPVKTLTEGISIINEKRAGELGITIPDQVIQKAKIVN